MVWLAVDKNGTEHIFEYKPLKDKNLNMYKNISMNYIDDCPYFKYMILPKGSIKKLIGRELTFDDGSVEI